MSVASISARIPPPEDRLHLHRQMIESLPSPILVCDPGGTIVEHNAAAAEFFHDVLAPRRAPSLMGCEARDCFPDFPTTLEPLFQRAVAKRRTCHLDELRLFGAKEADRYVSLTVQPILFDGDAPYLMVSLVDVTQSVLLRENQQNLQRMESVGALAGGLAHDVNNILFAIGGHAALLRQRDDMTEDAVEELDRIEAAIERARGLTEKLLTFARGGCPKLVPVSVNEIVLDTVRMLSASLGRGIEVELSLDPQQPLVLADGGGLQQVVMNFCVNARDAMEGRGRLRIRTARSEACVTLEVEDTGPGIAEDIRPRIFEPFFTTKKDHGTGLGLSVVYGLVKNFGGTVTAGATPLGGARFTVRLPNLKIAT
ncbi:MAG TPA: ATP-binding protein [Thermoanaerobaculia bacterium]|nr:ATP-binding protein [Thermoanaerobaculia bacterium]